MRNTGDNRAQGGSFSANGPLSLPPEKFFRQVLRRAVLWPVAALLVATLLLLGLLTYLFHTADRADHSQAVLAQISRVEKLAVDMETGVRGYRITSDPVYLEPYQRASAEFDGQLDALEKLLAGNSFQLNELQALRRTHRAWNDFATNVRQRVQTQLPVDIPAHLEGKRLMDTVRGHIAAMQGHERRLLAESAEARGKLRIAVIVAITLAAIIVAPLLALSVWRALRRVNASYHSALGAIDAERERLSITLSSIGDAVIATDAQGRVTYMNPVAAQLTGWNPAEAAGQPLTLVFKIINEHSRKPVENPVENAVRDGCIVGLANHTLLIAKDGRETPIADSAAPIRDESGAIIGVVLVFRDQTAERDAARKVEWLASFPEKNPNPVIELDASTGAVAYANSFAEQTFPHLKAQGMSHEFLAGLKEAAQPLVDGKSEIVRREMTVGESCFVQTISYLPDTNRLRVYCSDITETKTIEAELRHSRDQIQLISDRVPALISYVDSEQRYQFCNRAYLEWFGLTYEQMLGHTMREVLGEEAWRTIGPHVDDALAGQNVEFEALAKYRTGPRWIHASYTPHRDAEGRVVGIVVMVTDITARKHGEETLRKNRERMEFLTDASQVGVWFCDLPFDELVWDHRVKEHFWLPHDARVTIDTFYERLHPDDRERTRAAIAESIANQTRYDIEYRTVAPDGRDKWVRAIGHTQYDAEGRPIRFDGVTIDIDQQKRSELLLDSQKHSLELAVSGAPLGQVLTYLARVVEEQSGGKATASILLLDSDGLLRDGASPSLPEHYLKAIDGLKPCSETGTCAAAAATCRVVITPDIDACPRWQTLKHLPMKLGFLAAWSQPIVASDGRVLGTFGTYFRECREPTAYERQTVEILARTAALAIERRRIEDDRKRFVSLAENSSDFIGMCDANFLPFFVNSAGLTMVGLDSFEQARRTPVQEFFFPEDQGRVMNEFFPKVLKEGSGEIEIRFRHFKTGQALWMLYNVWVVNDDAGKFAGLATVSRDITERKRSEEARAKLAAIVESSDDAIISKDLNGVITSWNLGAERLFGYTAQEAIGQPVTMLIPPDRLAEEPGILERIRRGELIEHFETVRRHKDGRLLDISLTVSPIVDSQGRAVGASKIARDITERKRSEEALRRSQAELAKAHAELEVRAQQLDATVEKRTAELRETIQQLETFSYSIVHDMRAPLRSMRSFAGFLHKDYADGLDTTAQDYLRRIMDSSARMDALITDVLNYSRVSRGAADLAPVDLDRLVPEVIEQYPNLQENADAIRLVRPLPKVSGNTALLTQVFSNLLGNALKFVPEDRAPKVNVRAETNHETVRIWVEDNGIGVATEHRERIFGLFQRLHRPDEYAGTGVGLAIVKRAVEKMGGNAGVESSHENGSRFWIELRLAGAKDERN